MHLRFRKVCNFIAQRLLMKIFLTLTAFTCLLCMFSCNNKVVALQNNYQDKPYQFSVSSSKEKTITELVDVLTSKGFAIKTVDQNMGLITTDNASFLRSYSFENKDGSLTNPNAIVVCTKVRGPLTFSTSIKPESVTGQWILITKQSNNKTLVTISLANAEGKVIEGDSNEDSKRIYNLLVKSTGAFEKSVESSFN